MDGADRIPPVIWALFGLCLIPEAVLLGADFGLWGTERWRVIAFQNAGFWAGLLGSWRPNYPLQPVLMFASYGFLHAGFLHLLLNMVTLVSIGPPIVARIGPRRFVLLYLASLIGGAVGFAALSRVIAPMIGASGALFGLMGALLAWDYSDRRRSGANLGPVIQSLVLLLALNLLLWWAMNGHLAWETHLGGFLAGWIAIRWLDRKPGAPDP